MDHDDAALEEVESLFQDAALGIVEWEHAIARFARSLNSRTGQLIGVGRSGLPFNVMTDMPDEAAAEFAAAGGGDPWVNSRVRAGMAAGELDPRDDAVFTPEQDRLRSSEFGGWIARHRIGYSRLTNLVKQDGLVIGAAILRDARQPGMTSREKRLFQRLTASLRRAVRLQLRIEGQQARMIAGTFDLLDGHAFICGAGGRLVGMSVAAERLLAEGRWLRLTEGFLAASDPAEAAAFTRALSEPIGTPGRSRHVLHDPGGAPLFLELFPFPAERSLAIDARTLIVARTPRIRVPEVSELARTAYRLTAMEARVAAQIASGQAPAAIAQSCQISVETVRTHLKRVFDKTGTRSQVELAALLLSHF